VARFQIPPFLGKKTAHSVAFLAGTHHNSTLPATNIAPEKDDWKITFSFGKC